MKRRYLIAPREATVTEEGSSPFDAEQRARKEHSHLRGADLIVVAASIAWQREADPYVRSHAERLADFTEQAGGTGAA